VKESKTVDFVYFTCGLMQEKHGTLLIKINEIIEKVRRLFKASGSRPCIQD